MKETKYFCELCGSQIIEGVSFKFSELKTYVSIDLNSYERHAHTGCIKELGKELKELEELPF